MQKLIAILISVCFKIWKITPKKARQKIAGLFLWHLKRKLKKQFKQWKKTEQGQPAE